MSLPSDTASAQSHSPDALLPAEMARKAESIGQSKAQLAIAPTFVLAILAGAFIAWGGVFSTIVATGGASMPYGMTKLAGGLAFSLGLILVIVGGAELFTGNNLIVMAWASGRITTGQVLRNWSIVYLGNFVGAAGTAVLIFFAQVHQQDSGAVGETMLRIAEAKCRLPFFQAVTAGIGCNILVCLAVWLCMSARTVTDKVLAIVGPITAFVATGMEHCVANMYFVPLALMIQSHENPRPFLNVTQFLVANLLPVTLGNLIGGVFFVGLVYWFVYLRPRQTQ